MKSIQSIRRGERLTILILVIFFIGMGILVFKVVRESSFYMSHSDDVTLGKVYDRNDRSYLIRMRPQKTMMQTIFWT